MSCRTKRPAIAQALSTRGMISVANTSVCCSISSNVSFTVCMMISRSTAAALQSNQLFDNTIHRANPVIADDLLGVGFAETHCKLGHVALQVALGRRLAFGIDTQIRPHQEVKIAHRLPRRLHNGLELRGAFIQRRVVNDRVQSPTCGHASVAREFPPRSAWVKDFAMASDPN